MDAEVLVRQWLASQLSIPVSTEIPSTRPSEFVTVERVGGPIIDVRDKALITIKAWSTTRTKAGQLAHTVTDALSLGAIQHPQIANVEINSIVNYPDLDSGQARFQITAVVVVVLN